jgi:hypothetical protein
MGTFGNKKCAVAPESAMASLGARKMLTALAWSSIEDSSLVDGVVDAVASSDLGRLQLLVIIVTSSSS